jgi:hypothetical protein
MKKTLTILFFVLFVFEGFSQRRIPESQRKYLRIERGFQYQTNTTVGAHYVFSNSIFRKKNIWIIKSNTYTSQKDVFTKLVTKLQYNHPHVDAQVGLGLSYRYIFPSKVAIEPEVQYLYGYGYSLSSEDNFQKQQLNILFGLSKRYDPFRKRRYLVKIGLGIDTWHTQNTNTHLLVQFGWDLISKNLWLKKWRNPLFQKRNRKPFPEMEFFGGGAGKEAKPQDCNKTKPAKIKKRKKKKFKSGKKF